MVRPVVGNRYRVISDGDRHFEAGAIVVVLEDSLCPWCVLESNYIEGCNDTSYYDLDDYWALRNHELEEM